MLLVEIAIWRVARYAGFEFFDDLAVMRRIIRYGGLNSCFSSAHVKSSCFSAHLRSESGVSRVPPLASFTGSSCGGGSATLLQLSSTCYKRESRN